MLLNLIQALPAAVLVGVAPGWFWTKLLVASPDRVDRFAFSVALSIALVPAVMLVPTRLLGMGVTLAVAVASPLVVFCLGLGAWLRVGCAKSPVESVAPPPSPLGSGPLVLLSVALVLAVGVADGVLPSARVDPPVVFEPAPNLWVIPPIALLVILAGALQVRRSPAQPSLAFSGGSARSSGTLRRLLLTAVLGTALVRGYAGPVLHDWPFIRGVDHYSHAVMAQLMMTEGRIDAYLIYPPGFHATTAALSRLTGLEPLELFPVLAPLLLLLPALALYVLANRLWGWQCGVAAAQFSVLLGGTYYYFNDAMYPNLLTSQFLMVLTVAALIALYSSPPSARDGLHFAILGSSVVLYHQVASLYLALLLTLVGLSFVPYLLRHDRSKGVALFLSLTLLGLLSALYVWDTYDLGETIAAWFGDSGTNLTGDAVTMAIGTQYPYLVVELVGITVSQPVVWFGLLGALLAGAAGRWPRTPQKLAYLTLVLWATMLAVGACTSASGFPQRFGRDLGVPLAVFASFGFVAVLRSLTVPRKQAITVFVASLTLLTAATLVGVRAVSSLQAASATSSRMTMTSEIYAAGEWLRNRNGGGNIMVSPQSNQVPSRMMLAMGNYSALQSFERGQIEHPRDLPPTGHERLEDVLWVMRHPDGDRTELLLEKHDVDYVVLYKDMPDRTTEDYWRGFVALPSLYRVAFENGDVLIVTRRGPKA